MKKNILDLIIKILLFFVIIYFIAGSYLDILTMNWYLNSYYVNSLLLFLIVIVLVFIKLIINKKLFYFNKIISYDIKFNLEKIENKLLIQEYMYFSDCNYIKKERDELYIISFIENKLDDFYFSNLCNKCANEFDGIKKISLVIILIVDNSDKTFYKTIKFEDGSIKNTLVCGVVKNENKLYMLDKKRSKNYLKYSEFRKFIMTLFEV